MKAKLSEGPESSIGAFSSSMGSMLEIALARYARIPGGKT